MLRSPARSRRDLRLALRRRHPRSVPALRARPPPPPPRGRSPPEGSWDAVIADAFTIDDILEAREALTILASLPDAPARGPHPPGRRLQLPRDRPAHRRPHVHQRQQAHRQGSGPRAPRAPRPTAPAATDAAGTSIRARAPRARRRGDPPLLRAARPAARARSGPRRSRRHRPHCHGGGVPCALARGLRPGLDAPWHRALSVHRQARALGAVLERPQPALAQVRPRSHRRQTCSRCSTSSTATPPASSGADPHRDPTARSITDGGQESLPRLLISRHALLVARARRGIPNRLDPDPPRHPQSG